MVWMYRGRGGRGHGGRGQAGSASKDGAEQLKSPPEDVSYAAAAGRKVIQNKSEMPGYHVPLGGSVTPETATVSTMPNMTS